RCPDTPLKPFLKKGFKNPKNLETKEHPFCQSKRNRINQNRSKLLRIIKELFTKSSLIRAWDRVPKAKQFKPSKTATQKTNSTQIFWKSKNLFIKRFLAGFGAEPHIIKRRKK
ncbi:MAG: hypothetical protein IJX59_04885, partial [Clostridia bacterium]|nr:hypothetical protein [Clostridia bacterium]